jgi:hypothetical protein
MRIWAVEVRSAIAVSRWVAKTDSIEGSDLSLAGVPPMPLPQDQCFRFLSPQFAYYYLKNAADSRTLQHQKTSARQKVIAAGTALNASAKRG